MSDNLINIKERTSIAGQIYSFHKKEDNIEIEINAYTYGKLLIKLNANLVNNNEKLLFKYAIIDGEGTFLKKEGKWTVIGFEIINITILNDKTIMETVNTIRNMDICWPDDVLGTLQEVEKDDP